MLVQVNKFLKKKKGRVSTKSILFETHGFKLNSFLLKRKSIKVIETGSHLFHNHASEKPVRGVGLIRRGLCEIVTCTFCSNYVKRQFRREGAIVFQQRSHVSGRPVKEVRFCNYNLIQSVFYNDVTNHSAFFLLCFPRICFHCKAISEVI